MPHTRPWHSLQEVISWIGFFKFWFPGPRFCVFFWKPNICLWIGIIRCNYNKTQQKNPNGISHYNRLRYSNDNRPTRFPRVGSLDNHYCPWPSRVLIVALIIIIAQAWDSKIPNVWQKNFSNIFVLKSQNHTHYHISRMP